MNNPGGISLALDLEALRPLIRQIVEETVGQLEAARAALPEQTFSEEEAARWLGVESWVLRDERRRGRIQASQIVGRRIRYLKSDLIAYMRGRRWTGNGSN